MKFNNNLTTDHKTVSIHNELYSTPNTYDTYEKLLLENFISVIGEEENALLIAPITEIEVKKVISNMNLNKSPGIDAQCAQIAKK